MDVTFKGNGLVWDKERNKPLCKFDKSGEYKTADKRIISILKDNYESDYIEDKIVNTKEPSMTKNDVMESLNASGIDYNPRDKKEVLMKLLEE